MNVAKVGDVFDRLTVIKLFIRDSHRRIRWECRCSCGKTVYRRQSNLFNNKNNSCGCHKKDIYLTHNMTDSREYKSWSSMKHRCDNIDSVDYKYYGRRGISYCEEWKSFENFYRDMGDRPEGMTLDRKDNNKNYCKDNCKWSTSKEQANNKRYYSFTKI